MFLVTVEFYDPVRTVAHIETDTPYAVLDVYKEEFEETLSNYMERDKFEVVWIPVSEDQDRGCCFLAKLLVKDIMRNKVMCVQHCEYKIR